MQERAKTLVVNHILENSGGPRNFRVHIVWWEKARDNSWKAIIVSDFEDDRFYHVSYESNKRRSTIKVYSLVEKVTVLD